MTFQFLVDWNTSFKHLFYISDIKRQTIDRKETIDCILSQNQDVFQKKNVSIPYFRTDEPMSEQERIVEIKCDDIFQSLLFTVPGGNVWNLKQRIAKQSKLQDTIIYDFPRICKFSSETYSRIDICYIL